MYGDEKKRPTGGARQNKKDLSRDGLSLIARYHGPLVVLIGDWVQTSTLDPELMSKPGLYCIWLVEVTSVSNYSEEVMLSLILLVLACN